MLRKLPLSASRRIETFAPALLIEKVCKEGCWGAHSVPGEVSGSRRTNLMSLVNFHA